MHDVGYVHSGNKHVFTVVINPMLNCTPRITHAWLGATPNDRTLALDRNMYIGIDRLSIGTDQCGTRRLRKFTVRTMSLD